MVVLVFSIVLLLVGLYFLLKKDRPDGDSWSDRMSFSRSDEKEEICHLCEATKKYEEIRRAESRRNPTRIERSYGSLTPSTSRAYASTSNHNSRPSDITDDLLYNPLLSPISPISIWNSDDDGSSSKWHSSSSQDNDSSSSSSSWDSSSSYDSGSSDSGSSDCGGGGD